METNASFLCSHCPEIFLQKRNMVKHLNHNLTRKMSILAINAPEQVRTDGNFYKYLKLEQ